VARAGAWYEALKAREGALDFLDLLLKARDLIARHRRRLFLSRTLIRRFIHSGRNVRGQDKAYPGDEQINSHRDICADGDVKHSQ